MKKSWIAVPFLLAALFLSTAILAQAAGPFYTKTVLLHEDNTSTQPFVLAEKMTLAIDWTYDGTTPPVYKVPALFMLAEQGETALKTTAGKTVGTYAAAAGSNNVTVALNGAQAGDSGTITVAVTFNQSEAKEGTESAVFPTGETLSLSVVEAAAGAIKVVAADQKTKKPLAGAAFTVVNKSGKVVAVITTNAAGEASVPNLPFGSYTLTHTASPAGYEVQSDAIPVTLNSVLVTKEVAISESTALTGGLAITAVEKGTAKALSGIEFELKSENGLIVKKVLTDSAGKASLSGLPYGSYTLTQLTASDLYKLPAEAWTIVIGRQTPVTFKVENELKNPYGALSVKVTDADTDRALTGAEFSLYSGTTLVSKVKSNGSGVAEFTNVPAGQYTLEQTDAADGYVRSTSKRTVTIAAGKTETISVENKKASSSGAGSGSSSNSNTGSKLPQTGDEDNWLFLFTGLFMAAAGGFFLKGKRS